MLLGAVRPGAPEPWLAIFGVSEGLMMKRLLVLCAVLIPLSLFVAGCGATGGGSSSSGTMSPEQQKKMQEDMQKNMQKMQQKGGAMPGAAAPGAPAPGAAAPGGAATK
jgi:hypothetical protein